MNQVDELILAMESRLKKSDLAYLKEKAEQIFMPSHCNKTDESVLQAFAEHQRFANESEGTVLEYGYTLKALSKFSQYNLVDYDHTIIKSFLDDCRERCCVRTIAHKLTMIRTFYNYLILEDWITVNPCNKIPRIKVPKVHKDGINDIDLARVIKSLNNDRDRAIVEFIRSTGCRISEVGKLNVGDIDFAKRTAFLHQAKGKKDRIVSFDARCEKALKTYLKPFPTRGDDEPMFLRRSRNPKSDYLYEDSRITNYGLKSIMNVIRENSEVASFHAHAVRHNCITKLLNNRMPTKMVSLQAGHASVATTLDIYDDVTLQEMQNEYQKAMC